MIGEFAFEDFSGSFRDGIADLWIQSICHIDMGSSLLEDTECLDEWWGQSFRRASDVEVLKRPEVSLSQMGTIDLE
jgi:hypothetical protein